MGWFFAVFAICTMFTLAHAQRPVDAPVLVPGDVVRLSARDQAVDLWSSAHVLMDEKASLSLAQALALRAGWRAPGVPRANFGEYSGAVWMLWTVEVGPAAAGDWLIDVAYSSLDHADLYLLRDGMVPQLFRNGDRLSTAERPLPSRTHVAPVSLQPGRYTLMLRAQTSGTMIVPVQIVPPLVHQAAEERTQMLQGLATGVMLSLLLYSLAQWFSLRDGMFAYYGISVGSVGLFMFSFQGMGMQHLWGATPRVSDVLPPVCVLTGITGAFLFIERALDMKSQVPRLSRLMQAGAALCILASLLLLTGWLSYRGGQVFSKVMAPMPTLLALPLAWRRWRRGDHAAGYLIVGWTCYTAGVVQLGLLVSGRLAANDVTLHIFQVSSLIEMVMWLVVMGLRVDSLRVAAEQVRRDSERLRHLADTDALTGLLNRRGLQAVVTSALKSVRDDRLMGLFLIDLDGFKPINDRYGHHAGDTVLIEVANRLSGQVRSTDSVARTGGDEFVVIVGELPDAATAQRVGEKLMQALLTPMTVNAEECRVGATIGYTLAPLDGQGIESLLARADRAMYAGKQAGKGQLQRAQIAA